MKDVCVLFAYHLDNHATRHNFELLRRTNPNVDIHPVLFGDVRPYLPGSVVYRQAFPAAPNATQRWYWANCDLLIYDFFQNHAERYERYIYLEWDVICNIDIRDLYRDVWQQNFAARSAIHFDVSRQSWYHFHHLPYRKLLYFSPDSLAGTAPLCGAMLSERCLQAVVENLHLHWLGFEELFSEVRIATAAKLSQFGIAACGKLNRAEFRSSEVPFHPRMLHEPGIYHPVKEIR